MIPEVRLDEAVHTITGFLYGPLDGLTVTDWPTGVDTATSLGLPVPEDELELLGTDRFFYSHSCDLGGGPCALVWIDIEDID